LEGHAVDVLFRQVHRIKTNIAHLVALLLHRDAKPILLFHSVAFSFVVTGGASLLGLFLCGVMARVADDDSSSLGDSVPVGKMSPVRDHNAGVLQDLPKKKIAATPLLVGELASCPKNLRPE